MTTSRIQKRLSILAMTSTSSTSLFAGFVDLVCPWIGEPCRLLLSIVCNSSKRNEGERGYPTKLWMSDRNSPAYVNTLTTYVCYRLWYIFNTYLCTQVIIHTMPLLWSYNIWVCMYVDIICIVQDGNASKPTVYLKWLQVESRNGCLNVWSSKRKYIQKYILTDNCNLHQSVHLWLF